MSTLWEGNRKMRKVEKECCKWKNKDELPPCHTHEDEW